MSNHYPRKFYRYPKTQTLRTVTITEDELLHRKRLQLLRHMIGELTVRQLRDDQWLDLVSDLRRLVDTQR